MINLNGYDEVEGARPGEYSKLPAGGYVCIVTSVENTLSRNGTDMLVLSLDIAEGEYARQFEKATYPPKYYQTIYNGKKISRFFKGMLEDFEKSNSGFKVSGVAFDERELMGKKIGMIFAEEEYESDGIIKSSVKPRKAVTVDEIRKGDFEVPQLKKVETKTSTRTEAIQAIDDDDFVSDVEIDTKKLPFG